MERGKGIRESEFYECLVRVRKRLKDSYNPVDDHVAPAGYGSAPKSAMGAASREELVSVPVLGPE